MSIPFSIPTEYAGRTFRSRLEATFAFHLDRVGVRWEYEQRSFLLRGGLHYRPDFYLPDIRTWVECRGYRTEKGESQIEGFAAEIPTGDAYLVLRPGAPLRFVYPLSPDTRSQIADEWLTHRSKAHLLGNGPQYDAITRTIQTLKLTLQRGAEGDTAALAALYDCIRQRAALTKAPHPALEQSAA